MPRANRRRKAPPRDNAVAPTPEQLDQGAWARAGMAYRRVPVIDTLLDNGKLSRREYDALARYRDIALAEYHSPQRDSLDKALHGRSNGRGLPPALVRNALELGWLEGELGALRDIAFAVAVEDKTVSQWAMEQCGSVMRERSLGRRVITWFEPRRSAHKRAMADIRMAGERLAAAIRI